MVANALVDGLLADTSFVDYFDYVMRVDDTSLVSLIAALWLKVARASLLLHRVKLVV